MASLRAVVLKLEMNSAHLAGCVLEREVVSVSERWRELLVTFENAIQ
ncbi:MAG: hypothetical protein WAK26_13235 [Terracidiphilus sp.]